MTGRLLFFLLAVHLSAFIAQAEWAAGNYETLQPVSSADFAPPSLLTSALYSVDTLAQPDGQHVTFILQGPDGRERVTGKQCLVIRTNEIKAIAALDQIDKSEEFGKALVKAGAEKVESVKDAVKDPLGTAQRLPQGAAHFLGRVATAVKNTAEGKANPRSGVETALGVSRKKAELALQLGVSPYTHDAILQSKLDATARAMAGGALVVNLSGLVVSGGVGTAISLVNVNQTLQRTLIESSPEEMMVKNRSALAAMGASPSAIEGFLGNTSLSPWQKSLITADLKHIGQNPNAFLGVAKRVSTPESAVDLVQAARLLLKHHQESSPLVSLREESGVFAALDTSGTLLAPMAGDLILWTPSQESRADTLVTMAKADPRVKSLTLASDGLISARAVDEFAKKGILTKPQALGQIR
jgi:hypothetical protein